MVGAAPGVRVGVTPPGREQGVYGRASGLSSTEGEQGMYGCARGASSSLVWRARGASSSPVRWPRTLR